jgi:hypothetical protein
MASAVPKHETNLVGFIAAEVNKSKVRLMRGRHSCPPISRLLVLVLL